MILTKIGALCGLLVWCASPASGEDLGGFDCLIEPKSVTELGTRELGVLEEFLVDRGDGVSKGQVVARLESSMEVAAVVLAQARAEQRAGINERMNNLQYARRRLARIADLQMRKAAPYQEKDEAETEVRRAEHQLEQARHDRRIAELELNRANAALELRSIRSPFDGVVMERLLTAGESVKDLPILRIAQIDPLNVEVIIPAELRRRIRVGMEATVRPLERGALPMTASVRVVDRVIDAASDTIGVRLELPNPDSRIPAGIHCEIRFHE